MDLTSSNPPATTSASVPLPTTPKLSSPTSTLSPSGKMCVTPSSPSRKSRFSFHSDTKAPKEFNNLVDSSHVRQTEFFSRLNDTDRRVAAWISRQTEIYFSGKTLSRAKSPECKRLSVTLSFGRNGFYVFPQICSSLPQLKQEGIWQIFWWKHLCNP